ncbi:MAG: MBL fold metallo-hydrolase [Cyanobacteria bacterium P01_E01_bin.6]
MLFRQLFDPETSTYTYLIADENTQQSILVDPVSARVDRDHLLLNELGLTLLFCLETHIHADHITGTGKLRQLTQCQGIVPTNAHAACADRYIHHNQVLHVGTIAIHAIETNGHTDSHMAYLVNGTHLLTGDSLLIRGCGRTDFQSGDAGTLYDRVTQRLFTLPEDILVYPGHDYKGQTVSTIGEEKRFNPRFVGRTRDEFIVLMEQLNLPDPKHMMEAVPANEQCGQPTVSSDLRAE